MHVKLKMCHVVPLLHACSAKFKLSCTVYNQITATFDWPCLFCTLFVFVLHVDFKKVCACDDYYEFTMKQIRSRKSLLLQIYIFSGNSEQLAS